MWITARSMFDSSKTLRVDGLSKLTKVEDLREKLVDHFDAPVEKQMLIFRGKQLINGHTLFDYDISLNDIIQICVRSVPKPVEKTEEEKPAEKEEKEEAESQDSGFDDAELLEKATYRLGDVIDARDDCGAWYEAELVKVTKNPASPVWSSDTDMTDDNANITKADNNITDSDKENQSHEDVCKKWKSFPEGFVKEDGFFYHIKFEGYEDDPPVKIPCRDVRPRARHIIKLNDVKVGQRVMVNYNMDDNTARGYWYDAIVTGKRSTRTIKELDTTIFFGKDLAPMENCVISLWWEVFDIEKPGSQLNKITDPEATNKSPVKRTNKPECDICRDNPKKKCKECACRKCGGKQESEKQIMCDECDGAYHLWCLTPPLTQLPDDDEWFCPDCKNDATEIVQGGEKLKNSKKKSKMASASSTSTRDWGKGMACVGRTKMCTIVPKNHFGPVPGIEVGTMWKFRVQASEAGVHRPHVAGIHGRDCEGAYSIVLSGGYEDDEDNGDSFTYTGSGGRDLSGNKRTAEQSCDQILTRTNRALAKNCNCSIDNKNGAEAKDWRGGKPVRVVRNCKGRKHSDYAPEEGNRYDGIYKVAKYWPEKGKSGFIVWRYMFKRDDATPAPWSKAGKKRMEELGLEMQYPEGYLESQAEKEKEKEKKEMEKEESEEKTPKNKRGRKRKVIESSDEENEEEVAEKKPKTKSKSPRASPIKKKKVSLIDYKLNPEVLKSVDGDEANQKVWEEAMTFTTQGAQKFLAQVEELFGCICCQDIVFKPVTTTCSHNVCKSCIQRSFKANVYSCPACRFDLGEDFKMPENKHLRNALVKLFPGYEAGR